MNRIILGVASVAGASTIALSLLAAPAFAADAVKPTETLTNNVTVQEFVTSGVQAKFAGLTPGASYQLVFSTTQSGGPVGDEITANAKGDLTARYVAPNPGKKYLSQLVGDQYTLALYGDSGAVVSKTFAVKLGSELRWNSSHRDGKELTIKTTAKQWNASTGKYVPWHHAVVKFQEKKGSTWKTVKTVKTNTKGVAKATIKAGKHTWRAVVSTTGTVWTSRTGTHKK